MTHNYDKPPRNLVNYGKALEILPRLLEGVKQIAIAAEFNVVPSTIVNVKKMFPLFFWKNEDE